MIQFKKVWPWCAALALIGLAAAQRPEADAGLVGYWPFDAGAGAVARDRSGRGGDGRIHDCQWVTGRFGTALRFNGETSYVRLPAPAGLDGSNEMTVEVWVFWEGLGRYPNIVTAGSWNPGGFLVFVSDAVCSFRMGRPGPKPWTLGRDWRETGAMLVKPIALGRWYHLAAVFKRPRLATYVNGRFVGGASWNYPVGLRGPIIVGRWSLDQGKTQSHCGIIDELKLYKRALRPEEIRAHYEQEAERRR